jgi:hypothetical protein
MLQMRIEQTEFRGVIVEAAEIIATPTAAGSDPW